VAVTNTILAYNDLGVAAYLSGAVPVTFSHDCLFGNTTTASGIPDPTGSNGTIATDPRLAGAALGNVRLAPDSPCRDAGDAAAVTGDRDIYGQPRLLGVTADIGAAESDGSTPAVAPVVIRVSPVGDDEKDGFTWATAKRTIQAASDAAVGGEVWIAGGAYPETVRLNAITSLYGGFSGAESNREDRDPVAHPVVVDGQGGDSALTLLGGFSFATIDGFGLTGADTGIDMTGASPTISHCTLTGTGVHGILATGGSPSIVANTIRDAGFAVYATDGAPDITGNTLIRNRQGIYLLNTSGSVSRNTVLDNTTVGVNLFEGGVSVRNNVLSGNGSAGLYAVGGSHAATGNTFLANGTAVNSASATLALTNSLVAFNYVGVQTTGASTVSFSHDCIYGNATDTAGIADPAGTNGNINIDPGLTGAALGDFHLAPDSPCRGTGDLTAAVPGEFDIDGEARTANGAVSIGADEPDGVLHTQSPVIIRVRPDGDDGRDGLSWSMAKRTLSSAAASAIGGEVWVAAGTYPGSVSVPPFVSMYGGFAGAEAAREGRNPAANPTIVDPAGSASGFRLNGGYRFTTLSGFTVRNARSGVFATTGLPVIASNTFTDCRLGLHLVSAAPIVVGNFLSVHAAQPASLILCEGAPAVVANNLLTCDAAASNGVIGVDISGGAGPTLVNNTIARLATGVQLGSGTTSAALANNIIALNNRGLYSLASPRPVVTFRSNDIGANTVNVTGLIDPTGGSGNISGDPQFQDAPNGDFRLSVLSPGRDAGDDGSVLAGWPDVAGNPRITGDHLDMGAYEFNGLLLPDALAALKIAAGLQAATPTDLSRLNIGAGGDGAETVDLVDAAAVLRKATGLDR
jgi:parallel beta-helix repeat protein